MTTMFSNNLKHTNETRKWENDNSFTESYAKP